MQLYPSLKKQYDRGCRGSVERSFVRLVIGIYHIHCVLDNRTQERDITPGKPLLLKTAGVNCFHRNLEHRTAQHRTTRYRCIPYNRHKSNQNHRESFAPVNTCCVAVDQSLRHHLMHILGKSVRHHLMHILGTQNANGERIHACTHIYS